MSWEPIVAPDFDVPVTLETNVFILEPLTARHNEADHAAWTSSIEHIRKTPGFAGRQWSRRALTVQENAASIEQHADHRTQRVGFTYTVIERISGELMGSVYLYPPRRAGYDVDVRSLVRADRSSLDPALYRTVYLWLATKWPFTRPDYAQRP